MADIARTIRELFSAKATSSAGRVTGYVAESLERRVLLAGVVPIGTQPVGPLTNKIVFTSAGHGWQWNTTLGRYATDRGDNNEIVEDFGNQDQLTYYADYLFRAGATVVPMRPIGRQTNEVVVDNDLPAATFSGAWSNSSSTKFYDEDYGAGAADAVPYRYASTTTGAESAVATYTPNIPQAGFYPVYTWVLYGTDRTSQLYRVNHTGGATEVRVDHSKVGSGWVYLGTYHFNAGSSPTLGSVQISNQAAVSGKVVIADAIRFGNGMGDYIWSGSGATTVSGYPREDENSYHWIARSIGQGSTISGVIGSANNVSAPSDFAQYMFHGVFGEAVYVGFHSNAGGGRGARGLIDASSPTPHQSVLATYLGNQINQDMQNLNGVFEYNWTTGTTATYTSSFGEINLGSSANMDATIIEVAFHDDVSDAAIMRDPKGRDQIARSVYEGTLQYFAAYGSPLATNTTLPTAPINVRAVSSASGAVTISWSAGPSSPSSVYGAAVTGFRVYISTDGYGFDGGTLVSGAGATNTTITGLNPALPHYFKVVAVNVGGESKGTEEVTSLPGGGTKQILIVNGFDRFDRTQDMRYGYLGGLVDRVWSRYNNSFDYVSQFHTAINASKPGTHVDSTSNEAVINGLINLGNYESVLWILGSESTADHTFDATEQTKVINFLNAGGNLFVSGAEIAWDLDAQNNGRSFYENTLKGNYIADSAGTYTATTITGGIFAGLSSFVFSNGSAFSSLDSQTYNVSSADVIAAQAGALNSLNYSGVSTGVAGIQVQGTGGKGSIVMFGFPFETMTSAARRQSAMGKILDFFTPTATPGVPILITDSGVSGDNITNFNNSAPTKALVFNIPGTIAGATVTLLADGVAIGTAVASGTTTAVTANAPANGSATLSEGLHLIRAQQVAPGNADSAQSNALSITIDSTAPSFTSGTFVYNTVSQQSLTFQFSENVGASILATDLVLHNNTTNTDADSGGFAVSFASNTATFTFPGLGDYLPSGNYTATLGSSTVEDVAGNTLATDAVNNFYFQVADADHNGTVAIQDFNVLAANYGLSGQTFSTGNFDYSADGKITISDFNLLAAAYGKSVSTLPPAAPSSVPASTTSASRGAIASTGGRRALFSARPVVDTQDELDGVLL